MSIAVAIGGNHPRNVDFARTGFTYATRPRHKFRSSGGVEVVAEDDIPYVCTGRPRRVDSSLDVTDAATDACSPRQPHSTAKGSSPLNWIEPLRRPQHTCEFHVDRPRCLLSCRQCPTSADRAWNAGPKFVTDSQEQDCPGTSGMGSCVKSSCSLPPLISQLAMMQAFGVAG
jgi:hypothetical protein